jgi:hypothetical protein
VPYIEGVPETSERARGREDPKETLRVRLTDAPGDYLDGALDNPSLGPDELVVLLRSREVGSETIARVGRNRSWLRHREVKLALVNSPRAPQVLARRLLPHLTWRDLADVAANLRLSPILRREAERLLTTRLPELAVGEKMALARRGGRGIVEMLREETDGLVLQAVAGNPRATEADVSRMVSRADAPAAFLAWVADRSSWGARRSVRLALVRHPRTPAAVSLRLTRLLSRRDAEELRHDFAAPRLVRVAAERLLADAGASLG